MTAGTVWCVRLCCSALMRNCHEHEGRVRGASADERTWTGGCCDSRSSGGAATEACTYFLAPFFALDFERALLDITDLPRHLGQLHA